MKNSPLRSTYLGPLKVAPGSRVPSMDEAKGLLAEGRHLEGCVMAESAGCACGSAKVRVLFSCSGAADTGEISDRVARRLARGGAGRMACLSGIGGRVPYVMSSMQHVSEIWAVDGCAEDCCRHTLEGAGFTVARHLRVTDCGLEKGKSPASEDNVARVLGQAQAASS